MSTPTKPICNAKSNGVQYYTTNPLENASNFVGGMSGISSVLVSLFMFLVIFFAAYASRGFDALTIVLGIFIILSLISLIWNYFSLKQKPDGYTEDCESNPRFN